MRRQRHSLAQLTVARQESATCAVSLREENMYTLLYLMWITKRASLVAQHVKDLPAIQEAQETWVQPLGQDPLEEEQCWKHDVHLRKLKKFFSPLLTFPLLIKEASKVLRCSTPLPAHFHTSQMCILINHFYHFASH